MFLSKVWFPFTIFMLIVRGYGVFLYIFCWYMDWSDFLCLFVYVSERVSACFPVSVSMCVFEREHACHLHVAFFSQVLCLSSQCSGD